MIPVGPIRVHHRVLIPEEEVLFSWETREPGDACGCGSCLRWVEGADPKVTQGEVSPFSVLSHTIWLYQGGQCQLLVSFFLDGEGNGSSLQYSCLENPMDSGAWRASVHRVTKSRTAWLTHTFSWKKKEKMWGEVGREQYLSLWGSPCPRHLIRGADQFLSQFT